MTASEDKKLPLSGGMLDAITNLAIKHYLERMAREGRLTVVTNVGEEKETIVMIAPQTNEEA